MNFSRLLKLLIVLLVVDIATMFYCAFYGPHPEFLPGGGDPTSYRIIFIHVPASWNMYVAFTITLIGSLLYLLRERVHYDVLAYTSAVLGVIYGIGSITTGMIWANEVWGLPWSWDPRQTTTLIVLLSYIGYIALRASISDIERARTLSSAYGIAAYATLPISYLSAVTFKSLHEQLPSQPLSSEAHMLLGIRVILSFAVFLVILAIYNKRVREKLEVE